MFRIKICGVTGAADARSAVEAGADAIGLNFYPASRRYLPPEAAKDVAAAIPHGVLKVGVFVNADPDFVCDEHERLRLDLIQLAGNEPPEYLLRIGGRLAMQAFRPALDDDDALAPVISYLNEAHRFGYMLPMALIDAYHASEFGGTGRTFNWQRLSRLWNQASRTLRPSRAPPPMVLAGGLKPENVAEAIRAVRPWAVDVASGVESSPGVKNPELMRRFVSAARAAFDAFDVSLDAEAK